MLWYETRGRKNRVTRLLLNIYERLKFKFSNLPLAALCLVKKVSCPVSSFRKNVSKIIWYWMMLCNVKDKLSDEAWICKSPEISAHNLLVEATTSDFLLIASFGLEAIMSWKYLAESKLSHISKNQICKHNLNDVSFQLIKCNFQRILFFFQMLKRRWEGRKTIWVSH